MWACETLISTLYVSTEKRQTMSGATQQRIASRSVQSLSYVDTITNFIPMGLMRLQGMERRIIYDFVNVINDECKLNQALVKDKRCPNMHLLAASQTKDKTALKEDGVERVLKELRSSFDFIVCDSPAGIEAGAYQAMLFSDVAIVCTNPELSSVRDSDKMIGFISSNSSRARKELPPVEQLLLITRYNPTRVEQEDMLSVTDIKEMLGLPLLGVIPDVPEVLSSINMGKPVIMHKDSKASGAYQDAIDRFFGEERELRFISPESKGLFSRLFGS